MLPNCNITDDDLVLLRNGLTALSTRWSEKEKEDCNRIFNSPHYSSTDYTVFFSDYFSRQELTKDLLGYLLYPLLDWIPPPIQVELQLATVSSFRQKLSRLMEVPFANANWPREVAHICALLNILVVSEKSKLPNHERESVYRDFLHIISTVPGFTRERILDPVTESYIALAANAMHNNILLMSPLTAERIEEICLLLRLPLPHATLLRTQQILLADNNQLNVPELEFINQILVRLGRNKHDTRMITHRASYLAPGQQPELDLLSFSINIDSHIGGYTENGFPEEVPSFVADGFVIITIHELNHRVDKGFIERNHYYQQRKIQLIRQAGDDQKNYLRSGLPAGFFRQNVQEFVASISNMFIINTELTLQVALARFAAGFPEPLNQFLFFVELYSHGENSCPFFQIEYPTGIQNTNIQINRDEHERVVSLTIKEVVHRFELDNNGNVLKTTA